MWSQTNFSSSFFLFFLFFYLLFFYFILFYCFVLFHTHSVCCWKVNAHAKNFPTFLSVSCPQLQCCHSCHHISSLPNCVVHNVNHLPSLCCDLYVKNVRGSVTSGVAVCTDSGAAVCTVHMYCAVHCTVTSWWARALTSIDVAHPIRDQQARTPTNQKS